jgi:hypothetical protein
MPKRGGDGGPQGKLNFDSIRAKMTLKDATRGGLLKVTDRPMGLMLEYC